MFSQKGVIQKVANKFWTPAQSERMRDIEGRMFELFRSWGYREVVVPLLDDSDGKVLSVRPDLTTAIDQMINRGYLASGKPLRLCSRGTVYRMGQECHQLGVELVGVNSLRADGEIAQLAMECLSSVGLSDFTLVVGAPWLVHYLMEHMGLSSTQKTALLAALMCKDLVSYQALLQHMHLSQEDRSTLRRLSESKSLQEAIDELELGLGGTKEGRNFTELLKHLQQNSFSKHVIVNLGLTGNFDYYTGFVFEVHIPGANHSILTGGRYQLGDTLAVGMALDVGLLVQAGPNTPPPHERWLLLGMQGDAHGALLEANRLRAEGLIVEMELVHEEFETAVLSAQEKGYEGVFLPGRLGYERILIRR